MVTAILILAVLPAAHADSFIVGFHFTATDLYTAIKDSVGTTEFNKSAYFAVFVQPDSASLSSYNYNTESSPNPLDPNPWTATIYANASNPPEGYPGDASAWIEYAKGAAQTSVTVVGQNLNFVGLSH